jgi:hypothetical protein
MFCLSSRKWFVLCLARIPYIVLVLVSGIGSSSIDWTQLSSFCLKTETESSLRNVVFLNKNRTMDNVRKHNIYIVIYCLGMALP